MKEPQKYAISPTGGLRIRREWNDWRKQALSEGFEKNNASKTEVKKRKYIGRRMPIDPETHVEQWKEIAWVCGSERRILFCCCQSGTGRPFDGCGAVGIRNTRAGKITVVVEPRFE